MVALQDKNWIETHGEVMPNYETEPNAPHFSADTRTDSGSFVSDVYEGFIPPAQELSSNEQRFYAIAARAIKAEQHEDEQPEPAVPSTTKELPSDDNRDMWRQPVPPRTQSLPAPRVVTGRGPGYRTAAQRNARAAEAQARHDRWGR